MRAGATGAGQVHLRNAAWCERINNAKRSFRRAGAAQEGSHVGFVFVDGQFEGSFAVRVIDDKRNAEGRLTVLQNLLGKRLITKTEFLAKRKCILSAL